MNYLGTRNVDGIYFRLKDVSVAFKMKSICDVVVRKNEYKENVHYKIFILPKRTKRDKKEYLTFEGLLRVIMTTKSETYNWSNIH